MIFIDRVHSVNNHLSFLKALIKIKHNSLSARFGFSLMYYEFELWI